jgi:hypothetical protein
MENKMIKTKQPFRWVFALLQIILIGCVPVANNNPETLPSATEEFSGKIACGDGYIAQVPIDDVKAASQD